MTEALNMVPSRMFADAGLLLISGVYLWVMIGVLVGNIKERLF